MLTNSLTLKRKCVKLAASPDGKIVICIDQANKASIIAYVQKTELHLKKWKQIVNVILNGYSNSELYGREDLMEQSRVVRVMKFYIKPGYEKLYCKEYLTNGGLFIVITELVYSRKKSRKVSKKDLPIIEKIGQYEYEIEKFGI